MYGEPHDLPCHFILDGKPMGRGTFRQRLTCTPSKDAYFCTKCAKVWLFMIPHPNSGTFIPRCVACPMCGGGSVLEIHPGRLSPELMARELLLPINPRNFPHAP